jgi:hypothetical protein
MLRLDSMSGIGSRHSSVVPSRNGRPLFVVLEGVNDVVFLKQIAAVLRHRDPTIPDLDRMDCDGTVVFVPIGGGDVRLWAYRQRNMVERLIGLLKESRRIFSRFEKTAKNFGGMLKLAFIQQYLRYDVNLAF